MITKQWIIKEIKEWAEAFVIALILAIIIRSFIFQVYKIPSGSMIPTLKIGDRVIAIKYPYGPKLPFTNVHLPRLKEPQVGDIIVFLYPENPKLHFVKRLIAKGGDVVEISNGTVFVNDVPLLDGPFRNRTYYNAGPFGGENQKIKVPEGYYYVLGDNSASSRDSRFWGFVPEKNLVGKVVLRIWPLSRFGRVH